MNKDNNHIPYEITNNKDYLDSRDIQERIDWLESDEAKNTENYQEKEIEEFQEELETLNNLKKQYINDYGKESWGYGAQFIRDSYFADYAEEFCSDVGYISLDNLPWFIAGHIDWEGIAREMKMDYTEIEFDGAIYWTREA